MKQHLFSVLSALPKSNLSRKLMFGTAAVATVAIVSTAGIAAAAHGANAPLSLPTSKADCVRFRDFGFRNRGQCVSWWQHHLHHMGHGYGGDGDNDNDDRGDRDD